ncbi:hypothetical protein [Candidatus Viridilinea mediisalina]|uniref:Uncharacterized protein n=1 Tax=Candidatus Viridilinea mediisalina TaxID=2024553 RepID=A0A2A6RN18_9CHLR|nr:hypothetical protein [Candidatus Viridilinea mediisalina]PDW04474.1 hypothetical protein CJ255_03595 [Candidatus Viridilinea mediisalina]
MTMTPEELTKSVQFIVDGEGSITSVVLSPVMWHKVLEALDDAEVHEMVAMLNERMNVGPLGVGALRFNDVEEYA